MSDKIDNIQQSKLYYLLGADHERWQCSDPNYYAFITPEIIINKIIELAKEHFQGLNDKVIWDMFAGIGCDGLRLAKHAGRVICTELRDQFYSDLQCNISQMDARNVDAYHANCCAITDKIMYNIVYFDPPWGDTFQSGQPFDFKDVTLCGGKSVIDLVSTISDSHHLIIKSPISSNSFEELFGDRVTEVFTFTQQKLKFLIIKGINEIEY